MPNPYVNKVVQSNGTTLIDISDTTAVAADVASGKYFYLATGEKVAGTSSGGTPSATQHTILFEFTDETTQSITGYWDSSFISDAITATEPTTIGQKTVDSASLDGVAWYTKPVGSWETLFDDETSLEADTPYPYFWISRLADVEIPMGSVWRITFDGTPYVCTVTSTIGDYGGCIGNPKWSGGTDDGSDVPLDLYHTPWGAWSGAADASAGSHTLKVERQVLT